MARVDQAFVIFRCVDRFLTPEYLILDGPFEYPRWTTNLERASQLPLAKASQWAEAVRFGPTDDTTRAIPAEVAIAGNVPPTPTWQAEQDAWKKKRADFEKKHGPPDTKREGWVPVLAGACGIDYAEGMD